MGALGNQWEFHRRGWWLIFFGWSGSPLVACGGWVVGRNWRIDTEGKDSVGDVELLVGKLD